MRENELYFNAAQQQQFICHFSKLTKCNYSYLTLYNFPGFNASFPKIAFHQRYFTR